MGRVAVDHHDFRFQGEALQGAEVKGSHFLGLEPGQGFHLFEGRAQIAMKSHLAKELPQFHDGVRGRSEAEGQHAGHADEIVLGEPYGPAVDPGHGDPLADGHPFAKNFGGLARLGG